MSEPLTHRKASGHITVTGWYGEVEEGDTLSCVHCQGTWVVKKGSGKMRGWCERCCGYVCGPPCSACVPAERRWENLEAGRPELTPMPAMILVPAGIEAVVGFNGLVGERSAPGVVPGEGISSPGYPPDMPAGENALPRQA